MTEMKVEWVGVLPPAQPRATAQRKFAEILRTRPNVAAKWPTPIKLSTARSYVSMIRRGDLAAFAAGEYHAEVRDGVLHVCYVQKAEAA